MTRLLRISGWVTLLMGLVFPVLQPVHAEVRYWCDTITIPTYIWEEDINPKFWAMEGGIKGSTTVQASITYPYTMQDHLLRVKEDRRYQAVYLENEYLRIICLPELGGRLHSVLDKTQNQEMFHLNNVIKPSMIAMRGGFISGGVEWNAGPQVHTVTIMSPVDVIPGRNPDGSAYLEINNLEKSLRTRWTVRLTLHPGKAYLDEIIRLYNPIEAMNPYYFWNCTAQPQGDDTRFIYPMKLGTDHYGVKYFSWPIHEGKDLSWLKNHDIWTSIFAYKCDYDFFGAYHVNRDRGVVQVSNHYELPGKKAWTWGTWEYGLVSQTNLTDDDGPYIEVQSGPLPTQSDYGWLTPRQQVSWQEWWYPVHNLGDGFEYATKDLAIQREQSEDEMRFRMISTGVFPAANCILRQRGKMLLEKKLDLSPQDAQVISLQNAPAEPIEISIQTHDGETLAQYVSPLPIPTASAPSENRFWEKPDEELTPEETCLKGQIMDRATNRLQAREYYQKCLKKDNLHRKALFGLAVLDFEAGQYASAQEYLQQALQRKPKDDGLSWYFLGMCHYRLRQYRQALSCGYQTARCPGTESLGYDLAGRAYLNLGDYENCISSLRQAVLANPDDTRAQDHLLLALYARGDRNSALAEANRRLEQRPTDLVPRAILALQAAESLKSFAAEIRGFVGEVEFQTLETALVFADMMMLREAAELVRTICLDNIPESECQPLPLYYLGYLYGQMGGEEVLAGEYLARASQTYRDFVFPSRPEEIPILLYALDRNPDDAYAHLHIGNLLAGLGRVEEAVPHWETAGKLNPALSITFRNLALYYQTKLQDLDRSAEYYQQAIAARPADQTLYRDWAEVLIAKGNRAEAISVLCRTPFDKKLRDDIKIILAQAYVDEKLYDEAIDLLEKSDRIVVWEGSTVTWDIYRQAHMERGKKLFHSQNYSAALQDFDAAQLYPENLGVGRGRNTESAEVYYWQGQCLQALQRPDEAQQAWQQGAQSCESSETQNNYRRKCALALLAMQEN